MRPAVDKDITSVITDHESERECGQYPSIAAYALIGDCHTAALIARDGSIDWYCPKRFDGPAVFCRLLDAGKGGFLRLSPSQRFSTHRRYRGQTNVLETVFTTSYGKARLTDFMPIYPRKPSRRGYDVGGTHQVLRLVEGLSGDVELELQFKPTFDYARSETKLSLHANGAVANAGGQYLSLTCPGIALEFDESSGLRGKFRARAGERQWISLAYSDEPFPAKALSTVSRGDDQLARTIEYWENWASHCTYKGPYYAEVLRSALVLKLLIHEPTGGLVAAPTTSLPEEIGGVRNWDYRYVWLRDYALMLYALMTIGYDKEATEFFRWLQRTLAANPAVVPQILYCIDGGCESPEITLEHLEGYGCSRPVRIGNAAAKQRQLDVYGEILNAAHLHFKVGTDHRNATPSSVGRRLSPKTWRLLSGLVEQAAKLWQQPDNSIWEWRGGRQRFLYSQLMCWVALDRGISLAREYGLSAPLEKWLQTRDDIGHVILSSGFDSGNGTFVQVLGGKDLDASALVIPRIGFLPATDPRVESTIERVRAGLMDNGLLRRYRTPDGLPGSEGAFAPCTFWLVDALALSGQIDEACELFERVTSCANDVGLLSEEIDAETGELLGNFPQGFTHLGLIRSAVNLSKAIKHGPEIYPETETGRAAKARAAAAEGYPKR